MRSSLNRLLAHESFLRNASILTGGTVFAQALLVGVSAGFGPALFVREFQPSVALCGDNHRCGRRLQPALNPHHPATRERCESNGADAVSRAPLLKL
jgi:hypothetical protein